MAIPVFVFAEPIVRLFRDDAQVMHYAVRALRLQSATLIGVPLTMVTEMGFQSTGQRLLASFSSSLRSGLLFIPVLLLLAHTRGMAGIQEAQPAAFVLSFLVSIVLSRVFLQHIDRAREQESDS